MSHRRVLSWGHMLRVSSGGRSLAFRRKLAGQDCVQTEYRTLSSESSPLSSTSFEGYSLDHPECNVPHTLIDRVGRNLHLQPNHPLRILKDKLEGYFGGNFDSIDSLSPIVSAEDNFDSLLVPKDHISRSYSDTYYLNRSTVLRTHTSCHQVQILTRTPPIDSFLVSGDVYRRDEIDSSHYPVFHQMEGVKVFSNDDLGGNDQDRVNMVEQDLKTTLEGMARDLFGDVEMRWVDEYFPFTDPSFELEIFYQDGWMEVLGCGVVQQQILTNSGRKDSTAWAFGLGLERLAMVLFSIPDIRLFWTDDERFHSQFQSGEIVSFQQYSKYPPCFKDIAFWIDRERFHPNDLMEIVRTVAGDLVERVELVDSFVHPKTGRVSNCFRIAYRSMDRSLTNEEIDALQEQVRTLTRDSLDVELR